MYFIRMGELNLTDVELHPKCEHPDGTGISFELLNTDILERAHFYDEISTARIEVYVTYVVKVICKMQSGHTVKMVGKCTPYEYQRMLESYQKLNNNFSRMY